MSNLRERRRIETAREIQLATLELAQDQGFDAVTTDAISRHLGISKRTFFNYYANKEMALMGLPPTMPKGAVEVFIASTDSLINSLRQLMKAKILGLESQRAELTIMLQLMDKHPKISQIRLAGMIALRDELSGVLTQKCPDYSTFMLNILADILLSSAWSGVELWLRGQASLAEAFDQSWAALQEVSGLLLAEPK